jgi:hypothetical protein
MGGVSGHALNPSETENIFLLTSDIDNYCVRYTSSASETTMTLDVTDRHGVIGCGAQGSVNSSCIDLLLSPTQTTTRYASTSQTTQQQVVAVTTLTAGITGQTAGVTTTAAGGETQSAGPITTSPPAYTDQQPPTTFTTPNPCTDVRCAPGQRCDLVNGTATCIRNNYEDRIIKAIVIGVLVGSALAATVAGLALVCAGSPRLSVATTLPAELNGAASDVSELEGGNIAAADTARLTAQNPQLLFGRPIAFNRNFGYMGNTNFVTVASTITTNR